MMIAHKRKNSDDIQSVSEHCKEVSKLCGNNAICIHGEYIGKLQGILHDVGKMTQDFEDYILEKSNKNRGEIDHSFAGAKYLYEFSDKLNADKYHAVSRLIAHTIISHHGVHDWISGDYKDYCLERIHKHKNYDEIFGHMHEIISDFELSAWLEKASQEYESLYSRICELSKEDESIMAFYLGMLERFFQSALIDADRIDTANFMTATSTEKLYDTEKLWLDMSERIQQKCDEFSEETHPISIRRCNISDRCAKFAEHPVKICRLIVPTGGGKTLSSLRFAIEYCKKYHKKKIIYTAPFMSILEQNSDEICKIAGKAFFIEHHSNILAELKDDEELHEYELRTEKWDSPVIATTMVQFLNTLFSHKSSCIRRMHRLADAVIIIDEVQSVPLKCVHLFNLAMNFLSHICGATIVLCSATQPTMEQTKFPIILDKNSSMTGDTTQDFEVFRRTEIIPKITKFGYTYEETAKRCQQWFTENGNLLVIVNTKSSAGKLFKLMKESCPEATVIYLSTNLCPLHRKQKIDQMKMLLESHQPLICVTTQLIEAGVDISFRCVVRSLAGLDNATQAAGRCNRNGESNTICPVYLIKLKEENVQRLDGINTAQQATRQIFRNPEHTDYLSYEAQNLYFHLLYKNEAEKLSYRLKPMKTTILELLSLNKDYFVITDIPEKEKFTCQAFRTAGENFQVIDNHTIDVIVPYNDDAKEKIEKLNTDLSPEECRKLLREVQKYTVSIYEGTNRKLYESNAIYPLKCGAIALDSEYYNADCGVITEGIEHELLMY